MRKVIAFFPCRNEAKNLDDVLYSMLDQTYPFYEIIIINDNSSDRTKEIAESYGVVVIDLKDDHPSYIGRPELAGLFNHAFTFIYRHKIPYDYLMQHGADTLLPSNYVAEMVRRMDRNTRIAVAGGVIRGEMQYETHVRGLGRFYRGTFWDQYVNDYPIYHTWESYPLFKALSVGLLTRNYPDLEMIPLRPTRLYKSLYGRAMRELGYFPPFAVAKCFLSILYGRREAVEMFRSYISAPNFVIDDGVKNWIRRHQIGRILRPLDSLKIWISRI